MGVIEACTWRPRAGTPRRRPRPLGGSMALPARRMIPAMGPLPLLTRREAEDSRPRHLPPRPHRRRLARRGAPVVGPEGLPRARAEGAQGMDDRDSAGRTPRVGSVGPCRASPARRRRRRRAWPAALGHGDAPTARRRASATAPASATRRRSSQRRPRHHPGQREQAPDCVDPAAHLEAPDAPGIPDVERVAVQLGAGLRPSPAGTAGRSPSWAANGRCARACRCQDALLSPTSPAAACRAPAASPTRREAAIPGRAHRRQGPSHSVGVEGIDEKRLSMDPRGSR